MFKVGDYALVIVSKFFPEYSGTVCQIIEPYENRLCTLPDGSDRHMLRYIVRMQDGNEGAMSFRNLRHINPPDEAASWDACEFKPERLTATVEASRDGT